MVILSAPRTLETVSKLFLPTDLYASMGRQFLPALKLHNPQLAVRAEPRDDIGLEFNDGTDLSLAYSGTMHEATQAVLDADKTKSAQILTRRKT